MKKHYSLLLIFSICTIFTLLSCDPTPYKTGKATIYIDNKIEDSTFSLKEKTKSTTVLINEYRIIATGPNGAKIDKTVDAQENTVSFDSIRVGSWDIKVKAINNDNIVVGEGSTTIRIEEEKENLVNIDIQEKEGKGKLVVSIECNTSSLPEIKVTSKKSTGNTVTEKLIKDKENGKIYYSTALDIDNGIYTIDILEDNNVKYSDEIRIIDGAVTYFYSDSDDSTETTKIKNKIAKAPLIMFDP